MARATKFYEPFELAQHGGSYREKNNRSISVKLKFYDHYYEFRKGNIFEIS